MSIASMLKTLCENLHAGELYPYCSQRAISCYLFTQQCERAERAIRNCFDDVYNNFEKLDSLEPVKKRGKRKLHPNHNIIYAEHVDVMDYAEPVINIVNITTENSVQSLDKMSELECQKCWQVLPSKELLLNHENSHPKSMWFNCRLCGKSFVKRSQLRKHIKDAHKYIDDTSQENQNECFKCKECGLENKSLGEHFQHIEKHKFKLLLNSLMQRKDDSLCTVCLDKSSCLTNLADTVHLHGGYSGLTGDKSIKNILTVTVPGPNQYKYEELLFPQKAKILKLKKRKLYCKEKDAFSLELNEKFGFTTPVLVKITDFDSTSSITFTFAKPFLLNPVQGLNEIEVCEYDINGDQTMIVNSNIDMNESEDILKGEKQISTFEPVGKTTCIKCWIFKTPSCNSCLTNEPSILKDERSNEVIEKDSCKLCWIFTKSGKCENCNKYVGRINKILRNTTNNNTTKDLNELKLLTQKSIDRKKKWECNVCLTTNSTKRVICICCDEEKVIKESAKTNFDIQNAFYTDIKSPITSELYDKACSELKATSERTECVDVIIDTENLTTLSSCPSPYLNETMHQNSKVNFNEKNIEILPDNVLHLPNIEELSEDSKMDVEITPLTNAYNIEKTHINNSNSLHDIKQYAMNNSIIEDMDIAFDNQSQISTTYSTSVQGSYNQYIDSETNPNVFQSKFTFNLGVGDSKDIKMRRTKRALRRIATTSYK
ncbi:jg10475 [Pararge aegeria aegeria]|uniref:Jg10475 protein n=1 Tax=Pararge aegeria aegeria TaxID=348720 RepID=A0A8S4RD33_9NEOP|nr:jg10475 [Pararge aegeria aegeria]